MRRSGIALGLQPGGWWFDSTRRDRMMHNTPEVKRVTLESFIKLERIETTYGADVTATYRVSIRRWHPGWFRWVWRLASELAPLCNVSRLSWRFWSVVLRTLVVGHASSVAETNRGDWNAEERFDHGISEEGSRALRR